MKSKIMTVLVMATVMSAACAGGQQQLISRFENSINVHAFGDEGTRRTSETATIQSRMQHHKAPGASISVIVDQHIAWQRSYGFLEAGKPAMVDEHSLFQAGSVTKLVTALLVMHYVEAGLFDLDEDVNTYLKSWQMPVNDFNRDTPVTLRLLLSHQAGLPLSNMEREPDQPWPSLPQILDAESPAINKPAIPAFKPGTQWSYSNIGYVVLQLVLEDKLQKSLAVIANEVIFEPLGMKASTFQYPLRPALRHREAMPHSTDGEARQASLDSHSKGQGGLLTSTSDMSKLLIEMMKVFHGESTTIISETTMKLMLERQVDVPTAVFGFPIGMGLGVFVDGEGDNISFMHPGHSYPGTTFVVLAFPGLGQGVAMGVNGNKGDRLQVEAVSTLAELYGWPSGDYYGVNNGD